MNMITNRQGVTFPETIIVNNITLRLCPDIQVDSNGIRTITYVEDGGSKTKSVANFDKYKYLSSNAMPITDVSITRNGYNFVDQSLESQVSVFEVVQNYDFEYHVYYLKNGKLYSLSSRLLSERILYDINILKVD